MDRMRWMILLMFLLLAGITASQVYWIIQSYNTGRAQLETRINTVVEQYAVLQSQQDAFSMLKPAMGGKLEQLVQKKMLVQTEKGKIRKLEEVEDDSETKVIVRNFMEKVTDKYLLEAENTSSDLEIKKHKAALSKLLHAAGIDIPFEVSVRNTATKDIITSSVDKKAFRALPVKSKRVTLGMSMRELELGFERQALRDFSLKKMAWLLAGNVVLIILAVVILLYLTRTLLSQKKLTRLKDDFINNMTHELKTPVAAMQVILEALDKYNFIENKTTARQYLSTAGTELSRLSILIDKILKTSLLDQQGILAEARPVDLIALCSEVAAGFRSVFEKHDIRFTTAYGQEQAWVMGDRDHLANVIYTLLDNACKYRSAADPQILLRVAVAEGQVAVTVQDNGIGISKEHLEAIFGKFYRVPTGDVHNIKGHGLGLYYARQVVRHHRGEIYAAAGDGSTVFTIKLPVYHGTR